MKIEQIDHIVLTVQNIEKTIEFYITVLGMEVITFGKGRKALRFGNQKINLHLDGKGWETRNHPKAGSGDICLITSTPIPQVVAHLQSFKITILEGPTEKSGAMGPILSVYFNDPDSNLIEVSNYP